MVNFSHFSHDLKGIILTFSYDFSYSLKIMHIIFVIFLSVSKVLILDVSYNFSYNLKLLYLILVIFLKGLIKFFLSLICASEKETARSESQGKHSSRPQKRKCYSSSSNSKAKKSAPPVAPESPSFGTRGMPARVSPLPIQLPSYAPTAPGPAMMVASPVVTSDTNGPLMSSGIFVPPPPTVTVAGSNFGTQLVPEVRIPVTASPTSFPIASIPLSALPTEVQTQVMSNNIHMPILANRLLEKSHGKSSVVPTSNGTPAPAFTSRSRERSREKSTSRSSSSEGAGRPLTTLAVSEETASFTVTPTGSMNSDDPLLVSCVCYCRFDVVIVLLSLLLKLLLHFQRHKMLQTS